MMYTTSDPQHIQTRDASFHILVRIFLKCQMLILIIMEGSPLWSVLWLQSTYVIFYYFHIFTKQ